MEQRSLLPPRSRVSFLRANQRPPDPPMTVRRATGLGPDTKEVLPLTQGKGQIERPPVHLPNDRNLVSPWLFEHAAEAARPIHLHYQGAPQCQALIRTGMQRGGEGR